MLEFKQFDSYEIVYWSGTENGIVVDIFCLMNGTQVGTLNFVPDGNPIPPSTIGVNNILFVTYSLSQFKDIINILQLDKKAYVFVNTDPANPYGAITTNPELVGAEEGK